MVVERRVFNRLPDYLKTDQNNRSMFIADDVLFEPERAGFLGGYIGDTSILTDEDLARLPAIRESSTARQKYQVSLGAVLTDPITGKRSGGAFYPDLVQQIAANGGITSDPNRLFETPFYAWTPPIDYDKHINFSRYYWTGGGNAAANGEYVTKEAQGSQTVVHVVTTTGFDAIIAVVGDTPPVTPSTGDIWEDTTTVSRLLYQWDGSGWIGVPFQVTDSVPASTSGYTVGDYVYVGMTGETLNRPLVWKYVPSTGRWISQPIAVGPTPLTPVEGMIWEDATITPARVFRVYTNGAFVALPWTVGGSPTGTPTIETYIYDSRQLSSISDDWSRMNHWRHFDDLSPANRAALQPGDQATRPIVEFWAGLETPSLGGTRNFRNDAPKFSVYSYDVSLDQIGMLSNSTTLFQYKIGVGRDDNVLGFPLSFNDSGEFQFELTLETDIIAGSRGYRYFKDAFTGMVHAIWSKSTTLTVQDIDSDGLAEMPESITSNPDHEILTVASRSRILPHMGGNIKAQPNIGGNEYGLNSYRWTDKNNTVGATIIDCETSLLRSLATLQKPELSIPDVIRRMSRDYNRVLAKFNNRLSHMWDRLTISDPTGALIVSPADAVDAIMTELFIGRNEEFAFFYSDMGTYMETQISGGVSNVFGIVPKPIFIPPSPARVGAAPTYRPESIIDRDGVTRLRGHDGYTIDSFNDDRDAVWLELQTRFFDAVPNYYRDETSSFSSRHTGSNFSLTNYFGNSTPIHTNEVVDVVADYNTIIAPTNGDVYFDTSRGAFVYFNGSRFLTSNARVDDIFLNLLTGEYFIYNGFGAFSIARYNRPYDFDYTTEDFRQIMRREFERWAVTIDADFVSNSAFDSNDAFTWNYRSAGLEGHYLGIYSRIYRTVRPHSHPWEIVGYTIQPDWWTSTYPPTGIASDGSPRYANTDPMWADIQAGVYNPLSGAQRPQHVMIAPIPVDGAGELLDPVAAGIVPVDNLVPERLDDAWVYGDGAPVEQNFISSPQYAFAIALAGYLMKPGLYVDTVWSELYIDIGTNGADKLWMAPHVVHRDTLTRPTVNDLPVHLETTDGVVEQRLGINAWISEYVKILGQSVTDSFGNTIRNTEISVGWKTSGFINQDRTTISTLSGVKIPYEDMHTILHRSPPHSEVFGSGVLVTREGTGYRVFGFDLFKPYFEIDIPVAPIAGGQIELREEFTAALNQHEYTTTQFTLPPNVIDGDTAKFGVIVNGLRLKPQHITVIDKHTFGIESIVSINAGDMVSVVVVTTQSNPSTRVKQFQISGVSFPYIDAGQGITQRIEYGRYFDTSTDVINFMLGYGRLLAKRGWVFDDEVAPGEIRDWLYGAKALATWILETSSPWQQEGQAPATDFFFSPFSRKAKFVSNFGQILNVEALQNGAYGILNRGANPIDPQEVFTSRVGNELVLTPNDGADDIYGIRVLVAEDQHVVFLSNTTKFNDLVYDPIIGIFQSTLLVDSYRSHDWNGRLEADGFIINQGDLLPNLEKQTKDFTRYYDRVDTLDDPVKRDQARELYGWYPNNTYTDAHGETMMMDAIAADDRSRFDYHRGMISAKGTIRPIIAFSRGTRVGAENVVVNEDWAWRWCEFGDTRRNLVRFRVGKHDFKDQVQAIEFNTVDNPFDNTIQVEEFDRNNPDVGRWIIPPTTSDNTSGYSYTMPIDQNGKYDRLATQMSAILYDTDTNSAILRAYHYDPENTLFDPNARRELDYAGKIDPSRYTDGVLAESSDGIQWGPEQVGQYWWDTNRYKLVDYRGLAPDYSAVTREWGKTVYFGATVTRVDDRVIVETISPYTGLPTNHDKVVGDEIQISGAEQDDYNGLHEITATNATTFEFVVQTLPATPATGDIVVTTAFVDIYEWVESPVPPNGWEIHVANLAGAGSPTGVPYMGDATSYVTQPQTDNRGRATNLYYFWIKNNTGTNPVKDYTADQMTYRIQNPTGNNIPWFGVVDPTHLVIFSGNEQIFDDYAIELVQDSSSLDYHTEWLLLSEGDRFKPVPDVIRDKIIDCLAGVNGFGDTVPSPLLAETEKFGSGVFPIQTVFVDRVAALKVFADAANRALQRKKLNTVGNITGLFPLVDEGDYWERAAYRLETHETKNVVDTVATDAVRDERLANQQYVTNDLITVVQSTVIDLWTLGMTDATYVVNGAGFDEVGASNQTVKVLLDENSSPVTIRNVFESVYQLLTNVEQNALIFSVLYEMMRQTPDADWFMKTSYITMQIFDTAGQSPFVRPNEVEAIIANALDTKPYRTKLRSSAFTYAIDQVEDMGVGIEEFPDQKISIWFDRLNCSVNDEAGWDMFSWDTERAGWDKPLWDLSDLGRAEYYSLGVQPASAGPQTFIFPSPFDPTLYNQRLVLRENGIIVNPSDISLSFYYLNTHAGVAIVFSTPLAPSYTVEIEQTSGFYEGSEPSLGPQFVESLFDAAPSDYKHHVARMMEDGVYAPFPSMEECYLSTPEAPQERIPNDVDDSVSICVRTDWTPAYAGWDTTPWDSTGWDSPPNDIGPRVFFLSIGNETVIPAGVAILPTSEDVTAIDTRFIAASDPYDIIGVDVNGTPLAEGVDYRLVSGTPWVVEILPQPDILYIGDGTTTAYDISGAPFGINRVYLNSSLLVDGVDYNIIGSNVVFTQPAPAIIPLISTTLGRHHVADGLTDGYATGHQGNSINTANAFIFVDGSLVVPTSYAANAATGEYDLGTILPTASSVISFTLGNTFADADAVFGTDDIIGDGTTSTFTIGQNANSITSWVFVDGRYQVLGVDYTVPVFGDISFTVAPIVGAAIHIRTLRPADYITYDMEHIQFLASGGLSDPIPGLSDAEPNRIIVFVGDQIQNAYSSSSTDFTITDGSPDVINWAIAPPAGTPITVRVVRSITIDQSTLILVEPKFGDAIRFTQNTGVQLGDTVSVYHNNFPVGPLGNFVINSVPTGYDVQNGLLVLDNAVLNGNIGLTYLQSRRADNSRSILVRMTHIADRSEVNHLDYEQVVGFEDDRYAGLRVLNTTDDRIYEWDGTNWSDMGVTIGATDQILVLQNQKILEFDGTNWNTVFETGDAYSTPPVLTYPLNGTGIVSGTYALGQTATAAMDFPEAYQIVQHIGGC